MTEGFSVVRLSDGHVMQTNFKTPVEAERYIRTDLRELVIG